MRWSATEQNDERSVGRERAAIIDKVVRAMANSGEKIGSEAFGSQSRGRRPTKAGPKLLRPTEFSGYR